MISNINSLKFTRIHRSEIYGMAEKLNKRMNKVIYSKAKIE